MDAFVEQLHIAWLQRYLGELPRDISKGKLARQAAVMLQRYLGELPRDIPHRPLFPPTARLASTLPRRIAEGHIRGTNLYAKALYELQRYLGELPRDIPHRRVRVQRLPHASTLPRRIAEGHIVEKAKIIPAVVLQRYLGELPRDMFKAWFLTP